MYDEEVFQSERNSPIAELSRLYDIIRVLGLCLFSLKSPSTTRIATNRNPEPKGNVLLFTNSPKNRPVAIAPGMALHNAHICIATKPMS